MTSTPIRLLLAASACLLLGPPGHTSDAKYPDPNVPDPGLQAPTARPSRQQPPTPTAASPRPPALIDAEGTSYSPEDVRLGFLPVPRGFRRSGGGLVRLWSGAPSSFLVPGLDTPATITTIVRQDPPVPEPPSPLEPEPPSPPDPPHLQDVPGPLPVLGLAAAFMTSRKLRRRLHQ